MNEQSAAYPAGVTIDNPTWESRPFDVTVKMSEAVDREPALWGEARRMVEYDVEKQTGAPLGSVRYDDLNVTVTEHRIPGTTRAKEYHLRTTGRLAVKVAP